MHVILPSLYLAHSYLSLTQKSVCSWFSFVSLWPFAHKCHSITVYWSMSHISSHGDVFLCIYAVLSATESKVSHTWNETQSQVDAGTERHFSMALNVQVIWWWHTDFSSKQKWNEADIERVAQCSSSLTNEGRIPL